FGELGEENPPARLVNAVARGDIDVALVWGPLAGYFTSREKLPLEIVAVSPATYLAIPFTYEISMAVRKGDAALRTELDGALVRKCAAIQALLDEYGVPQVGGEEGKRRCEPSRELPPASWR